MNYCNHWLYCSFSKKFVVIPVFFFFLTWVVIHVKNNPVCIIFTIKINKRVKLACVVRKRHNSRLMLRLVPEKMGRWRTRRKKMSKLCAFLLIWILINNKQRKKILVGLMINNFFADMQRKVNNNTYTIKMTLMSYKKI